MSKEVTVPMVRYAGFWLRIGAAVVDLIILLALLLVGFALVAGLAILGRKLSLIEPLAVLIGLLVLFAPVLYFWLLTGFTGQTIGKKLAGIKVLEQHSRVPGLGRSFVREVIGKFVFGPPALVIPILLLGFLWIGWDRRKQGWHDKVAGTHAWMGRSGLRWPRKADFPEPVVVPHGDKPLAEAGVGERNSLRRSILIICALVLVLAGAFLWVLVGLFPDYLPLQQTTENSLTAQPTSVTEPLDAQFLELGEANRQASKQEWQRLLRVSRGRARIVLLDRLDPSRDVLVFVPGIGVNFQDAHALAHLVDQYQVVIAIYNQKFPLDRNSKYLGLAIKEFMEYRRQLGEVQGLEPNEELRLIGHSFGCLAGERTLANLAAGGLEGGGPGSLFSRALFVCIDGPWRGFDVPWVFTLPGVKHVVREILPRLSLPRPATRSALSVANRTTSMNGVLDARFPQSVTVRLVTLPPMFEELSVNRRVEPVDSWYSFELAKGELEKIWGFFRGNGTDWNALDRWELGLLIRNQSLQHLIRTLTRDSDYPAYLPELRAAARESKTMEEFRMRYDGVIAKVVDTFQGQHTRFMWQNPSFVPWIRKTLDEW